MGIDPHAALREELGRIDYFLDHLARAVERGDADPSTYRKLAPRYLERRAEIVEVLMRAAARYAAPVATTAGTPSGAKSDTRAVGGPAGPGSGAKGDTRGVGAPAGPARRPVAWTTVLTYAGAFLVVVSAAVFSIYAWGALSAIGKLVFLGTVTAAFYVGGELVRVRLRMAAGGVALTAVASAMLLFDGWIVIRGFELDGVWPWALLLLVISAVYWVTEVRIAGGWFGALGAAAQIGWWWLAAQGLGWTLSTRMAVIALIAAAWSFAGSGAAGSEALGRLATVLRWGAPLVSMVACAGALVDLGIGPPGWPEVGAAALVGVVATYVLDRVPGLPRGLSAAAHLPFFASLVYMWSNASWSWATDLGGPASGIALSPAPWSYAGAFAAAAVVYCAYGLWSGGWGYALAAAVAECMAWGILAEGLEWSADVVVAVFAGVALSWVAAAALLRADEGRERLAWSGVPSFRAMIEAMGWAGLGLATVIATSVRTGGLPLTGVHVDVRDTSLSAYFGVLWLAATRLRRNAAVSAVLVVVTYWLVAARLAWLAPAWDSGWYALVLLALTAVWSHLRGFTEKAFSLPREGFGLAMLGMPALVVIGGLVAAFELGSERHWATVALLAGAAVYRFAEATRFKQHVTDFASGALAVVAASWAGWVAGDLGWAAVAGGFTGLALAGAGYLARREAPPLSRWWTAGAAMAASAVWLPAALDPGAQAFAYAQPLALAAAAAAWAVTCVAIAVPETSAGSSLLALFALFALLDAADAPSWVLVAVVVAKAACLLGPLALAGRSRLRDALAFAGALDLLIVIGIAWTTQHRSFDPEWFTVGPHGLAVVLVALGAYLVVWSQLTGVEWGVYPGYGSVLLAYFVEASELGATSVEWFSVPAGLYIAAMGYLHAARSPGRHVSPVIDAGAVAIGLGMPALLALPGASGGEAFEHALWTAGLALLVLAAGVVLRVRWYFFGGVAALVWGVFWSSWTYLVTYWWAVIGLVGIAIIVVALTWERRGMLLTQTRESLAEWR